MLSKVLHCLFCIPKLYLRKWIASLVNVDWCDNLLGAYHAARTSVNFSVNLLTHPQSPRDWTVPPVDHLRLDVDAAYNINSNSYAIGGIVRNHEGQPVLAFGKKIHKTPSVTSAELVAIEEGIHTTQHHHLRINQLTSDSLLAVQAVTCPKEDLSYNGAFVTSIRRLLAQQPQLQLEHVKRTANTVTHSLASFAISSSSPFVWKIREFPYWLVKLVITDLVSS
ncbi:uncharacterized protein [Primulina eburnea]|uniref:uncharacterized protein n=1 Tax=Primulina eburnea TaxID=1245227 RepID=UPI003C6C7E88